MTEKAMDTGAISVNPDTKGGMRRHSTGETINRGSSLSSTNNEKPLPHYLRPSTSSCHDICKYGGKHAFEAEAKHPFLPKLGNKVNNSNLEERRKRLATKPKSSSHQTAEFLDKPAVSKQKAALKIKEAGLPKELGDMKLQLSLSTQKSSISSDQEVPPVSANEETQVKAINLTDQKKKQVIKSETLIKSHSFSYKHKVGEQQDMSPRNGIGACQKSGIVKKDTTSPLQEATSSIKPKLVKQTSLESYMTHDNPKNLKQKPSVPNEIAQVNAKHVTSKKVSKRSAVGLGSPVTPSHEPTGQRIEKENFVKSREITKTLDKKMLKPFTASPSLKHIRDGISSLKQRQQKHGKETTPTKNQKVGKAEHDTQKDEEKASYVIDKIQEEVELESAEQKPSEVENVAFDSSKQPLSKCENSDLDSLQQKLLEPENADMGVLGQKMLELENINFESLDLNPDDQKLFELKNVDMDFQEQKLLNSENIDLDYLGLKPDDLKLLEQENADVNFLEQNLLKPEETGFESLKMEPTSQKLLDGLDFPEQKLLKPEDIDLDSMELKRDIDLDPLELKRNDHKLLKQENVDMNFLEPKLLKLETRNTDLDSLELKPNDDQSSQLATDDEEETEESESASSEPTELESEHEAKENNGNCESVNGEERRKRRDAVIHPEDKLSTPKKLKFRRGKIIELQPESHGPRRLRFRRGRMVSGRVDGGQLERKNFKRSEMSEAVADTSPEAKSIVLKHQDTQGKKDAQGLFNNVIEETASKLVETRKSKVKALVGAFETVISLQDSKPESTA